jgi:methyltransferase (TIGR00027 family)
MGDQQSAVQSISDTARWVAYFRAQETRRSDALFRDPYAEKLAGEQGFQIANSLPEGNKYEWAWVARTYLFDQFLVRAIQEGAELILNLAAGLDARPYRMDLSASLQWVEIDLPEIIAHKERILGSETPRCQLQRFRLDLSDGPSRRKLFADIAGRAKRTAILTEGLLIYLTDQQVGDLAAELAALDNCYAWIVDLASPGQLKLMQATMGRQLSHVGAPFKFAPREGPDFFLPYGWAADAVQGLLKTAAHFKRSPAGLLPLNTDGRRLPENYPWSGVCLLKRQSKSAPHRTPGCTS